MLKYIKHNGLLTVDHSEVGNLRKICVVRTTIILCLLDVLLNELYIHNIYIYIWDFVKFLKMDMMTMMLTNC